MFGRGDVAHASAPSLQRCWLALRQRHERHIALVQMDTLNAVELQRMFVTLRRLEAKNALSVKEGNTSPQFPS